MRILPNEKAFGKQSEHRKSRSAANIVSGKKLGCNLQCHCCFVRTKLHAARDNASMITGLIYPTHYLPMLLTLSQRPLAYPKLLLLSKGLYKQSLPLNWSTWFICLIWIQLVYKELQSHPTCNKLCTRYDLKVPYQYSNTYLFKSSLAACLAFVHTSFEMTELLKIKKFNSKHNSEASTSCPSPSALKLSIKTAISSTIYSFHFSPHPYPNVYQVLLRSVSMEMADLIQHTCFQASTTDTGSHPPETAC